MFVPMGRSSSGGGNVEVKRASNETINHFLPKAIARKTEQNTQYVNKDLHCITYAKKLTQSSPLQYK